MPSKRGPNWLPPDDEQLAKSWLKISEDVIRSTGQKKEEFWKRVADDFNKFSTSVAREGTHCMHHWGHVQKWTLKFSGIYRKLEKTRPSGSVMSDLLPDARKAFYEQEGKQFAFERAWMVLKDSPKWNDASESRGSGGAQPSELPVSTPTPSTPTNQANPATIPSQSSALPQMGSDGSWKRPPGVHSTKRAMKEDHYNAKKIKILSNRSTDYRDRTLAMKKTNDIRDRAAEAELRSSNMEIMSKRIEDLPDDISRKYLELQKEIIMHDIRDQVEERRKLAAEKSKGINQSASSSSHQEPQINQSASSSSHPESRDSENESSETEENEEVAEVYEDEIDPTLDDLA
ncbi:uncharacterized protein PGTG_14715 [Puccinia graminis f. sp. tritici CRL 75-36-700-3]|uniref:No apical meristem-associated C-terminal domain-containing protein n=2 Tax=Puccinia graminis f. sp. tritici TaxID=56615 RepID=E3KWT2_PUCGT|nr:uncharacterized protein PGTG_14715 [Puccinia graminis f. sp. tritici CRL 75-36-700-3]EFP88749.1 hypothetical protein PGTG_14715 [Puccinia graminis f. sp. tritici CRL 75-36-700-3]